MSNVGTGNLSRLSKICVSAFIGFYLFIMLTCSLPAMSNAMPYMAPVASLLGWEQNWSMFAPKVRTDNRYGQATIHFLDGSTLLYEFPRVETLNPWDQFRYEKAEKLIIDNLINQNFRELWPSSAQFLAACVAAPNVVPVTVSLNYQHGDIPPFHTAFARRDDIPQPNIHSTFFTYGVKPEDLSR